MMNLLVLGYGGLGQVIAECFAESGYQPTILSRQSVNDYPVIDWQMLPAWLQQAEPVLIINTIGCLHDAEHVPEKNIMQLDADWLQHSMAVNVWPTVQLLQAMSPLLKSSWKLRMVCLSARVSSISDNHLGGWYSYRMSKCALNMLIKNAAIEWARQSPLSWIIGYHPGTVDTAMSAPFQSRVPEQQLFSPKQAANYLLKVISERTVDDSGLLFDWQGKVIAF